MRRAAVLAGLALVLGVVGAGVAENERILRHGRVVRLALAPVDPRSLLQGDYMALNYEIGNSIRSAAPRADGYAIVSVDARGVAAFVRLQPAPQPRQAGEAALRYRVRGSDWRGRRAAPVRFATNAYFFEEGSGKRYETARFGEFRVSEDGEPRLVGLLDASLARLGGAAQ